MKKILFLLGTLLLFASSVMAYDLPRWDVIPIQVYLPPDNAKSAVIQRAFNAWAGASNGAVRFRYMTSKQASKNASVIVTIDEANNAQAVTAQRYETVGYFRDMRVGFLYRADVTVHTKNSEGKDYTDDKIYENALMEVGYILGFDKVTQDAETYSSVMNYQCIGKLKSPTDIDRQKIKQKYTLTPERDKK